MFSIKSNILHGLISWTIVQSDPNGATTDLFADAGCQDPKDLINLIAELRADRVIDAGDEASLLADLARI